MSEIEFDCPYCNKTQFLEIEGMTEYDNYEAECVECGKKFTYRVEYSVDGYTDKINDLEGAEK